MICASGDFCIFLQMNTKRIKVPLRKCQKRTRYYRNLIERVKYCPYSLNAFLLSCFSPTFGPARSAGLLVRKRKAGGANEKAALSPGSFMGHVYPGI
jgi:hypothetical protein